MNVPRGPLRHQPDEPGWWLASDGNWYPPESRSGVTAAQQNTSFRVLAVRTADDDDSAMFPVLGDHENLIAFEDLDGDARDHLIGTGLSVQELVGDKAVERFSGSKLRVDTFITDARVAVACDKYDKGGGWIGLGGGAVVTAAALNAASHALASRRRRGKVLVGHVRYPWVNNVGFTSRTGRGRGEAVRIVFKERHGSGDVTKMLDVRLPSDIDAAEVARRIVHRCAAYHLEHTTMAHDVRDKCVALTTAERLEPVPGRFAFYAMPVWYRANPQTAFPKQPEPG
jgi:hypothetical protein